MRGKEKEEKEYKKRNMKCEGEEGGEVSCCSSDTRQHVRKFDYRDLTASTIR
jgi:hypothetical protein